MAQTKHRNASQRAARKVLRQSKSWSPPKDPKKKPKKPKYDGT